MDFKVSGKKKALRLVVLFLIFYIVLMFSYEIKSFRIGRGLTFTEFVGNKYVDEKATYYMYIADEKQLLFKELNGGSTNYYNYSFNDGIITFKAMLKDDKEEHEYNYVFLSKNHLYSLDFNKILILNK